MFERAVDGIVDAQHIAAFGLGLSSAIAGYFATQLNRFGLDVVTLFNAELLFAADLQKLREGDLVIMLAHGFCSTTWPTMSQSTACGFAHGQTEEKRITMPY